MVGSDEDELAPSDLASAMRVQIETKRPLTLIGSREYTRWRAWFVVEFAQALIREQQNERKRRRR